MTQAEGGGVVMGGQRSGPLDLDAAPSTEDYELGKLEQRGIELIPESDRKMRPSGLFFLWAGAIWNVEFLVYGALVLAGGVGDSHRQPLLRRSRHSKPLGAGDRHDRVHGQPRPLRTQRQPRS